MKKSLLIIFAAFLCACPVLRAAVVVVSDNEMPTANPKMEVEDETGWVAVNEYSGSAPIKARFTSNVENRGD